MLPTHRKHACPVCLHASHDGKLITRLRKLGLFRYFPPDYFLPSSESGSVNTPKPSLPAEPLPFLPSSLHTCLPSSLSPFSFLSFSLLSSPHLPLSHQPSFPLFPDVLVAEVNAIQQASGQPLASPRRPPLVSQQISICCPLTLHLVPAALLVCGPQATCGRIPH